MSSFIRIGYPVNIIPMVLQEGAYVAEWEVFGAEERIRQDSATPEDVPGLDKDEH